MVAETGTNTLGFFVWTIALTLTGWLATVGDAYYKNRKQRIAHPVESALRDSSFVGLLIFAGVFALVILCWSLSVAVLIYRDHVAKDQQIAVLQQELRERSASSMSMRINGWIVNQDQNHNAIVQVWLGIDNRGEPNTLRDWKIAIRSGNLVREGNNSVGQPALKHSLNLPFLDIEFQRPVGTVADMQGYVIFGIRGINQEQFVNLYLDHSATLIVSARDSKGISIEAEKNIYQTWQDGHETRPAK
jgi:hypothetical protein